MYNVKCQEKQCSEDYTEERARRLSERVLDHNSRDAKSHVVKHAIEQNHKYPKIEDFNIIGKSYRNNTFKRQAAKSLSMKDVRATLSTHGKSVSLKLFSLHDVSLFQYLPSKICKHLCGGVSFEVIIFLLFH